MVKTGACRKKIYLVSFVHWIRNELEMIPNNTFLAIVLLVHLGLQIVLALCTSAQYGIYGCNAIVTLKTVFIPT